MVFVILNSMNTEEEIAEFENRKKTFWSKIKYLSKKKEMIISNFRSKLEERKINELKQSITNLTKKNDET